MHLPRRHVRPAPPASARLTARDLEALDAIEVHRFMRSDHLHGLLFAGSSIRVVQRRLKRLFDLGLVERCFLPLVVRQARPLPRRATQPIYAVTRQGLDVLAEAGRVVPGHGSTAQPRGGLRTLEHHLVVTDFCVALRLAGRKTGELELETLEHEHRLWPKLAEAPARLKQLGVVVPDAAFTLVGGDGGRRTFYLEVIRAGVKGGNRGLSGKMALYARLNHKGFFENVYGHEHVRAIIFVTTSELRAEGFRALGEAQKHGRRLFWFGAYLPRGGVGTETVFRPETLLENPWKTAEGSALSLREAMTLTSI